MSTSKPLIVVTGATSKQGGSVVRSLLKSGKYAVRALTRDASSDEAKKLSQKGAEVVATDVNDIKQLEKAFEGAHGVFAMTPVVPPSKEELEVIIGKKFVDASVAKGVKHFVWSSLENVDKVTKGKYWVPHFTEKGKVQDYAESKKELVVTSVLLAFFYTNVIEYYFPTKLADGTLVFGLPAVDPDFKYPFLDSTTAPGPVVEEIFSHPEKYNRHSVPVVSEFISPNEIVAQFTKVTGVPAKFHVISEEEWGKVPFPKELRDELYQMFQYATEFGYYTKERDVEVSRKIDPNALTWSKFIETTGWKGDTDFKTWKAKNVT